MKAKVTGVTAWQGTPTAGTLSIRAPRYVDSSGNASPEEYSAVLDVSQTPPRWMDALDPTRELYVIVQGPDDLPGVRATFYEVLHYAPNKAVRTEFSRMLVSSDLDGLIFDYAAPEPTKLPTGFGDVPLTMRAAQQLLNSGVSVSQVLDERLEELDATLAGIPGQVNKEVQAGLAPIPAKLQELADIKADLAQAMDGALDALTRDRLENKAAVDSAIATLSTFSTNLKGLRSDGTTAAAHGGLLYSLTPDNSAVMAVTLSQGTHGGVLYDPTGGN